MSDFTRHYWNTLFLRSSKSNMAFLPGGSPRISCVRRTIFLCGLCGCVVFIMYVSSSSNSNKTHEENVEHGDILAPEKSPQYWTPGGNEDEEQFSVPASQGYFPEELTQSSKEFEREKVVNFINPRMERDSEPIIENSLVDVPKSKKILIWNSYWKSKALWHKIFKEIVHRQCPQSNCELTIDHSQLNTSDAVLFHLVDIVHENYTFPKDRDPNQIWIGMTYEPPYILQFIGLDFKRLNGIFNRTMSYRTDGDIVVRHGTYSKIHQTHIPSYTSDWVNSHDSIETRNYAEGKRRLVAWFASSRNCQSQSGREKYVKELQNYIQVDVYGSCGPYKCGVQKTMRNPYKVEEDDCYMLVSIGYKFVLAFENSLCEDYVTEKLYNHLKLNVVPVVLGASNYSLFAPPHSVIEASHYTPEELAMYLQQLDKNDTAYNEYFRWKEHYQVDAHDGVPLACDLCEQLHNPNWQVERKVYDQFDKWILSGCRKSYGTS